MWLVQPILDSPMWFRVVVLGLCEFIGTAEAFRRSVGDPSVL